MKRWPLNKAPFWDTAPFLGLLLPLVTGILLHPFWKAGDNLFLIAVPLLYFALIASALLIAKKKIKKVIFAIIVHMLLIAAGIFLCSANDIRTSKAWFGHTVNTADFYSVRITETPKEKENSWKLRVKVFKTILPQDSVESTGDAFVYFYKDKKLPSFQKGDTIRIPNKWMPIKNAGNPFEFDYAAYCARNNIFHQQFIGYKNISEHRAANPADRSCTDVAHDWSMQTLARFLDDRQALGLIQSMLIGDESNLDNDTRQAFTDTGIVHVIAISGGNIAMLFVLVLVMLRWIRHKKYLWIKYVVALPVVWFYVLMAGASPSAVRAALMFTILAFGFMLLKRRDANGLNQLFAAAFILLVAEPMWLHAIGFRLSFLAVLSLMLFYRRIYRLYTPVNMIMKGIWGTIAASIAAEILIAPLVIYYFHTFPLLFIISNIIAYLLLTIVLVSGMSILALSFIPPVAQALGNVTVFIVEIVFNLIAFLQSLEPKALHTLRLNDIELLLVYLFITSIAIYIIKRRKPALFAGLAFTCALIVAFYVHHLQDVRQHRLVVYAVGKAYHIELILGKTFYVVATDSSAMSKKEYAITPAHIGWQTLTESLRPGGNQFLVGGELALVLRDTIFKPLPQYPDYLIIAYKARLTDLRRMDSIYHPGAIVFSYTLPQNQLNNWVALSLQMGIDLRTTRDGPFILQE